MAKVARVTFVGEASQEVMRLNFPAIGKTLDVPLGELFEDYGRQGYRHGMKQRFGDFLALPAELSDREKDTIGFEKCATYLQHLQDGGDWRMNGERDMTGIVLEAMEKLGYKRDMLEKAVAFNPEQVKEWRSKAKVKAAIKKIYAERAAKHAKQVGDEEEIVIEVE